MSCSGVYHTETTICSFYGLEVNEPCKLIPVGRKLNLSEEERARRSELARRMHAERVYDPETGEERSKFGGPQANSGPKTGGRRAAEIVTERLQGAEIQDDIWEALIRGLSSNNAETARRAAQALLVIEEQQRKAKVEERRELEQSHRDAILGRILRQIGPASSGGDEVLEGDVSEPLEIGTGQPPVGVRELGPGDRAED